MAKLFDLEKIVEKIEKEAGLKKSEIIEKINEKKRKFAGLLTDEGAAYMLAKELGLDIELEMEMPEEVRLKDLVAGMRGIKVKGRVKQIFLPRKFEKEKKKGSFQKFVIEDESGEAIVTLWHDEIREAAAKGLEKGVTVEIENCNVSEFNGAPVITLGYKGKLNILGGETKYKRLDEIEENELVDVFGRVLRIFEENEFEKDGNAGVVLKFVIGDGKKIVRVVAWREAVEIVKKLRIGEIIKIENGFVKSNQGALEIHVDWRSNIIRNAKPEFEIPKLSELAEKNIERKRISEINLGDNVEIIGEVVDIMKGNLFYYYCTKCKAKAKGEICEICGNKTKKRLVISAVIDDGTKPIVITAYGIHAERLAGINSSEINEIFENEGKDAVFEEAEKRSLGKYFVVRGIAKERTNSDELEILASDISDVNFKEEINNELSGNVV